MYSKDVQKKIDEAMGIYRCESRDQALALAHKFQQDGKYKYFRGQTRNLPALATYLRLEKAEQNEALESHARLEHWINKTAGLESIRGNADAILAVAQHYGLPTPFLDFSTDPEVAAYFATCIDGRGYSGTEDACIICINMADLDKFLSYMSDWPRVEMLHLDVPNLWRIESQRGVFLHNPIINLESHHYGFDRILFPQTVAPPSIDTDRIYPPRKSGLEILLDEYFYLNNSAKNHKLWLNNPRVTNIYIDNGLNGMQELLINGKLPPQHPSWNESALEPWLVVPTEEYSQVTISTSDLSLHFMPAATTAADLKSVQWYLNVISQPDARSHLVDWSIADHLIPSTPTLREVLNRIWDGMRRLPYTNGQIASAMSVAARIASRVPHVNKGVGINDIFEGFTELFGKSIEIQVGTFQGGCARALVPRSTLRAVVREDIRDFVIFGEIDSVDGEMARILQAAFDSRAVYRFDALCDVYAEFVIPTQIIGSPGRSLNLFSPARLEVLGLP